MGFRTVRQWADSPDEGRYHITQFRKLVSSAATAAGDYIDYSYMSGQPPANFYASTPLESALVESDKGIWIPNRDQHLKRLMVMSAAASTTSTSNQMQTLLLCDYLMAYPFIDTDVVGEEQVLINSQELPRYQPSLPQTATNVLLNTDFKIGTVAGSPGTDPTNWSINTAPTGMTREIDFGTDSYGDYLQVRYYGTNTSGSTQYLSVYSNYTLAPTTLGKTWTGSAKVALVDGAWPAGVTYMQCADYTSGGSLLGSSTTDAGTLVTGPVPVLVSHTRTSNQSSTAFARLVPVGLTIANGETVDCTFRIYEPMFCERPTPAPYVKNTTSVNSTQWLANQPGVKMMLVSQAAAATYGTFLIRYTNQDGIPVRLTGRRQGGGINYSVKTCGGGGVVLPYSGGATSTYPFIPLQAGDTSIRSVEGITFTAAGGGLAALVLVKPIARIIIGEECRTNAAAFGAATVKEGVIHNLPEKIPAGAVLNFIGRGGAGSLASSILTGTLETTWSD